MIVKDNSKRAIVEEYQHQVQEAVDKINSLNDKPHLSLRTYIKVLEDNILMAPYLMGYLEKEDEIKKKKK